MELALVRQQSHPALLCLLLSANDTFTRVTAGSTLELDFSGNSGFFLYVQDKIKHIYFDIFDNIFLTTDQRYDNLM